MMYLEIDMGKSNSAYSNREDLNDILPFSVQGESKYPQPTSRFWWYFFLTHPVYMYAINLFCVSFTATPNCSHKMCDFNPEKYISTTHHQKLRGGPVPMCYFYRILHSLTPSRT